MIMKYKEFINGGVKYHFEEKEGVLHLLSLEIWGKIFEFPNGGIPAHDSIDSDAIKDGAIEIEDMNPDTFASSSDIQEMFPKTE